MKLKTLALAVAALAVLSVIAWFFQRPPAPAAADPRVGQPVLAATTLARTARIRLTDQGKTVLLVRQSDGPWIDSSYYDLPADFSKLSRFTDDLASAKVQRVVTRNPEVLARLNFKDTAVALLDAGGKELWRLTLGKGAESGGRFVQFADEPTGYLANLSVFLDADAKNWADSLLIVLKPEDVAAVEVGFAEGEPVIATRAKKEDAWVAAKAPAGQRIDEAKVTALLSSLTSLRFQDTSDLNDPNVTAARQHSRTITFTTFDHTTITIQLGRKPEEKQPEARSQPAAPKPLGEGGKSEVGGQGAAQANPESSLSADASAKPATQNSEPTAASAAGSNSEPKTQNPEPAAAAEPAAAPPPANPVYAFIASTDAAAPVNALMKKRAFQVYDWNFTSLPQKPDELFAPVPAPPPVERKTETNPAERTPIESKAETEPVAPATPEATPAAAPAKP
jgi:hypothetical protein